MRPLLTNCCHRRRYRSAIVAGDTTSSIYRAIIEDMKVVIENPVQNFVTTGGWKQLRMFIKIAQNNRSR